MSESYTDLWDLNDNPEIARSLGNLIIAWSAADYSLVLAMAAICGIHPNQAHLGYYRIPTFESRVKFLQAMIPGWETTKYDPEAISKAITALSGLAGIRNNWIHNVWSRDDETGGVVVFNFRQPSDGRRGKPVKAHDIDLHVATVMQRMKELRKLLPGVPGAS